MILQIFLLTIGIALALIMLGVILEDSAVQLVGFSFLFIAGSLLLAGSVEYKTGLEDYENYIYSNNFSGYHWEYDSPEPTCNAANEIDCVKLFHKNTTTTYHYANFNDSTSRWLGVYLMIISIIGSVVIFTRLKQERDNSV